MHGVSRERHCAVLPQLRSKLDRLTRLELSITIALEKPNVTLNESWQTVFFYSLYVLVKYFYTICFGNATSLSY